MTPSPLFRRAAAVPLLIGLVLGVGSTLAASRLGSSVFSDVPAGSYYDQAVGDLYAAGILQGSGGKYRPADNVNRAELAVVIDRLRDELLGNVDAPVTRSSSSKAASSLAASSKAASSQGSMTTAGAFRFTQGAYTAAENGGNVTITVSRAGGARNLAEVTYTMVGGTATAGTDFNQTTGTLSFGDGETSKTFQVQVLDDSSSESNETVTLSLQNPTNTAILTNPSTATLTITDNETGGSGTTSSRASSGNASVSSNPNGTLSFGATTYAVPENGGNVTITVNRTGGTSGTVGITYATSNGTGKSGSEYTTTTGTLTFNPGDLSKAFTVPIIDDATIDGSKTFLVTLSVPTGSPSLGTTSIEVTILDNDSSSYQYGSGSIRFSNGDYQVTENAGFADVTVRRTGGAQGTVSVNYEVSAGTALPGQDYVATTGTLTFLPGESAKIFRVQILKDDKSDSGEAANMMLMNVTGQATLGSPATATLTIYD